MWHSGAEVEQRETDDEKGTDAEGCVLVSPGVQGLGRGFSQRGRGFRGATMPGWRDVHPLPLKPVRPVSLKHHA